MVSLNGFILYVLQLITITIWQIERKNKINSQRNKHKSSDKRTNNTDFSNFFFHSIKNKFTCCRWLDLCQSRSVNWLVGLWFRCWPNSFPMVVFQTRKVSTTYLAIKMTNWMSFCHSYWNIRICSHLFSLAGAMIQLKLLPTKFLRKNTRIYTRTSPCNPT